MQGKTRYTILYIMGATAVFAVGFVCLFNESRWWRATLMTLTLCLILNSLIGTAVCRGSKQAYATGFAISSFFFLISLYTLAGIETIPFLLTQWAYAYLVTYSASPPSDDHFYIVAIVLWGLGCAYSGGLLGQRLYDKRICAKSTDESS